MTTETLKEVRVFAPATVANVACGYDVLGFAIDAPGDEVVARHTDEPGLRIAKITGDGGKLPLEAEKKPVQARLLSNRPEPFRQLRP